MMIPCEIAVKSVIPAMRAYVAKELTQTYKMRQNDVANRLGITQTAISKYVRDVRGQVVRIDQTEEIRNMMNKIVSQAANDKISRTQLTLGFCEVCKMVRRNGIMCELCKRFDSTIDVEACLVCKSTDVPCGIV
jgi:predicted transcriptional regulator